jgi:3-methyl-2-oxobutanoate hydroxymethyltransferase
MSIEYSKNKVTVPSIIKMKERSEKIAVLTAYDYFTAEMLDESAIDIILVGDSLGTVVAGFENTIPVSMDMMLYHVSMVKRATKNALIVADMPFLSYQTSISDAILNAGRFLKEAGAEAVKLEGGKIIAATIEKLVGFGIPVMGHLGLTPQSVHKFGGYKLIGKDEKTAKQMIEEAQILEQAGIFSLVLEKIPSLLAKKISQSLHIPTIGIGAGKFCDGQVLVTNDMLGIFDKFHPRFVRRYAEIADTMRKAFKTYSKDVKSGKFPTEDESYK